MDDFSAALQHLRHTHDKTIDALLLQVDELRYRCRAKEREVESLKEESERKEQQLVQLKKKLLRRNETILTLKGIRQTGADVTTNTSINTPHFGSPSLLISSPPAPTPGRPATGQTGALLLHPTSSNATGSGKDAMIYRDGRLACTVPTEIDENEDKTEEETPDVGYRRSVSSVLAYSPSLLDSSTSATRSLASPQSDKDEGGMSEAIFSPSLLNCEERTLPRSSTQMDLPGEVTSHGERDSPSAVSLSAVGSSAVPLSDPLTRLQPRSDQVHSGLEVPPSDTQYLVQSMNTFPMSPEIGMGSRKDLFISLDENKDCRFENGSEDETSHQSTHLEDDTKHVYHKQTHSDAVKNSAGVTLPLNEEERMSRTKQLALKKGKPTRKSRQKTLKTFLTVGSSKVSPELCGDESTLKRKEGIIGGEKSAGRDTLSSTTSSFLRAQKMTSQEELLPNNGPSPRKMQAIPKTTSSPIAPRFCKVVTVVPQTPMSCTSPSTASKASPRGWIQRKKEEGPHTPPPKWDPEETCLPHSLLDHSGSHDMAEEEPVDCDNGAEQGKPHSSLRRLAAEHLRFSTRHSYASMSSTKSVYSSVLQTALETVVSATTVNVNDVDSRRKRPCDDGYYHGAVNDVSPPPAKRHAVEDEEDDVDPPSSSQNIDAVIRRLGLPTDFKCNVPVRRKEDRKHLDARACQQCELWYKDNPGRMKQSCRHKELHLRSDTPTDFFRVDFTPTQDDSEPS